MNTAQQKWHQSIRKPSSYRNESEVVFLNESGDPFLWQSSSKPLLWLYNLHYFDDLMAEGAQEREDWHATHIDSWLNENPWMYGVGWQPYPLSLRIVNLIKWILEGRQPPPELQSSLVQQVQSVSQQVEYHLMGNHLFANAKALIFAGSFFKGEQGKSWLHEGLTILRAQIPEQILEDGGHFERSPMYHAIILEDLLDLYQLTKIYRASQAEDIQLLLTDAIDSMLTWLEAMTHPDGEIAFFNDATLGIASSLSSLEAYAEFLGLSHEKSSKKINYLQDSGYISVSLPNYAATIDVAEIGPDYIPGHAHADTLSFEWCLQGRRIFVNSGISEYGESAERLRQRGTSSHNTVVVDDQDSTEVWAGFRVARRARPINITVTSESDVVCVSGSHDGYTRLGGGVVHSRSWSFYQDRIVVVDQLAGNWGRAQAYFHLHPDISASVEGDSILLAGEGRECASMQFGGGEAMIEEGTWHPGFGMVLPNEFLVVRMTGNQLTTTIRF